ncbi:MAG TPA: hypothetical protein VGP76_12995 [Planctomycetaceae bacterium]|jgi:hypothetical protein|nr:hypothetical protein [Planctomycetaceae bacterium]
MSDEPKRRRRKCLVLALAATIVLACYEAMHYTTASWLSAIGTDGVCVIYDRHAIGGKAAPEWVERYFFWPAERIGDLIRDRPWNPWPSEWPSD